MINILKKLLDLIYEKKCYFCSKSKENSIFCKKCYNSIEFLPSYPIFLIDGVKVYAAALYNDNVKKLIRAVKFHNKKELAIYQAQLMFDFWKNIDVSKKEYTVVPVPMFFSKERKRNYNHMDLVGKYFAELTQCNFDHISLIRNRETTPQYKLSRKEREANLKNAFSLIRELKSPVLIIDDISTTGTTLKEIISLLKKSGIHDITCLVTSIPVYEKSNFQL